MTMLTDGMDGITNVGLMFVVQVLKFNCTSHVQCNPHSSLLLFIFEWHLISYFDSLLFIEGMQKNVTSIHKNRTPNHHFPDVHFRQ